MGGFLLLLLLVGGFLALIICARMAQDRDEARQLEERRKRHLEEDEARFATAGWLEIQEMFPFLPTPVIEEPTADCIYATVGILLEGFPGLGTVAESPSSRYHDFRGLRVPRLPSSERRRHLYVIGKTGSGKSTYLEHLIRQDLQDGYGVGVMSPEGEFFRERLLPLVPEDREEELVYFAPGDPGCSLCLNPLATEEGEDASRAAGDLFTIFRRALGEDDLGARSQPILQNAFATLVGRKRATLWDVRRLLEDERFRQEVSLSCPDEYVRAFWLETYTKYPRGAHLPVLNRLDQFLRPPVVRKTLCQPASSFSLREVLARGNILFVDLFGLTEETRLLIGQVLLSKLQLELMRRELGGEAHAPFRLFCDEFQSFAGLAEGTWRELLSRGRKYGLALTLAHQFPAQLPTALQEEILGNVHSLVAFSLGAKDAHAIRRELLHTSTRNGKESAKPIAAEALMDLPTGQAYAKFAGGRAVRIVTPPPIDIPKGGRGKKLIERSWERLKLPPAPVPPALHFPAPQLEPARPALPPVVPEERSARKGDEPPLHAPPRAEAAPRARPRPAPASVPAPGRGGERHKYLQALFKRLAEAKGYRATIEKQVLDGQGSVDLALEKPGRSIACEISVTTGREQEVGNAEKCLRAGFDVVALVCAEEKSLKPMERAVARAIGEKERGRVRVFTPEDFIAFLEEEEAQAACAKAKMRGYNVKLLLRPVAEEERKARTAVVAKTLVQQALRKMRGKE